jgi:hypothetical protein
VETPVKIPVFLFFVVASTGAHATDLHIFDQILTLRPGCMLEIEGPGRPPQSEALPFGNQKDCTIINLGGTNVPHLERVEGSYVFLIESRGGTGGDCTAMYTAVIVSPAGDVVVGRNSKRSHTCGTDRDRAAFEYLYHQQVNRREHRN